MTPKVDGEVAAETAWGAAGLAWAAAALCPAAGIRI